jgi:hypothetical protein
LKLNLEKESNGMDQNRECQVMNNGVRTVPVTNSEQPWRAIQETMKRQREQQRLNESLWPRTVVIPIKL